MTYGIHPDDELDEEEIVRHIENLLVLESFNTIHTKFKTDFITWLECAAEDDDKFYDCLRAYHSKDEHFWKVNANEMAMNFWLYVKERMDSREITLPWIQS